MELKLIEEKKLIVSFLQKKKNCTLSPHHFKIFHHHLQLLDTDQSCTDILRDDPGKSCDSSTAVASAVDDKPIINQYYYFKLESI